MGERYEAMIEAAQVATKQARLVTLSEAALLADDRRSSSAHREGAAGGRLQAIRADGPLPPVNGGGRPLADS